MPANTIAQETERLYKTLHKLGWEQQDCEYIAPTTLEINQLKSIQRRAKASLDQMFELGRKVNPCSGK